MQVILQKDMKNLGKAGSRVRVKPGYARNYLFPRGLAMVCDEKNAKSWKHKLHFIEAKKQQALKLRKELSDKLASVELKFLRSGKDDTNFFGSVTPVDISRALEEQGFSVDKRDIKTEPLKTFGEHKIQVCLDKDLETNIQVSIKAKVDKEGSSKKSGFFKKLFSGAETSEEKPEEATSKPEEAKESEE